MTFSINQIKKAKNLPFRDNKDGTYKAGRYTISILKGNPHCHIPDSDEKCYHFNRYTINDIINEKKPLHIWWCAHCLAYLYHTKPSWKVLLDREINKHADNM